MQWVRSLRLLLLFVVEITSRRDRQQTLLAAIIAIGALSAVFGLLLGWAAVRFRTEGDPVVDQIDALLPQTQCAQCGFPGCRPYANAIVSGEADINRCPPGGEATIQALADLLDKEPKPLDPERGVEKPKAVAIIDEEICIGCTLCIQACPVDAILGADRSRRDRARHQYRGAI